MEKESSLWTEISKRWVFEPLLTLDDTDVVEVQISRVGVIEKGGRNEVFPFMCLGKTYIFLIEEKHIASFVEQIRRTAIKFRQQRKCMFSTDNTHRNTEKLLLEFVTRFI